MASSEDAKFLKRKIKAGNIDVHPTEKALIVYYETEATILGETGNPMIEDRKECQKKIYIKNLSNDTDVKELARRIVENCKLLNSNKIAEVEYLLKFLKKRKEPEVLPDPKKLSGSLNEPGAFESTEINETAVLTDVDEYLELLYEDIQQKLRASALILQLARNPDNLEELFKNETLICALARVIREDWKKSTDLATNIIYIFFCFSSFSNFHSVIIHFKIGALCMGIIDHEQTKYDLWKEEIESKRKSLDLKTEKGRSEYEVTKSKFDSLVKKQEQFFRVAFYLLLNVSENANLEAKMSNKGINSLLIKCIDRNNDDLLILVASFLKKLSIFKANKDEIIKLKIADILLPILNSKKEEINSIILRLIYNLCFDQTFRAQAIEKGYIELITTFLRDDSHQGISLYILYQLSLDEDTRISFTKTDALSVLMRMILTSSNSKTHLDIIAILVNLACDPTNAKMIGDSRGIKALMNKALQNKDTLLMKFLRNLSLHKELKKKFLDYLEDLVGVLNDEEAQESEDTFMVEVIGLLANLNVKKLDFFRILVEFNLLPWILKRFESSLVENTTAKSMENSILIQKFQITEEQASTYSINDDILLETLRFVGTCCFDLNTVKLLLETPKFVDLLIKLINMKQEDDAIVSQIIYIFYLFVHHQETRDTTIRSTPYLMDLMHDKNVEIRKICDSALDILIDVSSEWKHKVQQERFRWHNSQWLDMINSVEEQKGPVSPPSSSRLFGEEDGYNNYYLDSENSDSEFLGDGDRVFGSEPDAESILGGPLKAFSENLLDFDENSDKTFNCPTSIELLKAYPFQSKSYIGSGNEH